MNALTGKETPSEGPEVVPTEEIEPKELSFNELMEQAAERARIEDKRK